MKYMGGKIRLKKHIVPILQKFIDDNNIHTYIEPFCGGCNIIDSIKCENKIAGDVNEPLIELLKYVSSGGELPNKVTKEIYDDVRSNKNSDKFPKWYIGAVGFLASYNGRYFDGGYAKPCTHLKTGQYHDYYDESRRSILKQSEHLKNIKFTVGDYTKFSNVKNTLIYCDPPYINTKGYSKNINHIEFWQWARDMSDNNIVVVSELVAPSDFKCIWEMQVKRTHGSKNKVSSNERLFVFNNNISTITKDE